jgi:hypothetical protein
MFSDTFLGFPVSFCLSLGKRQKKGLKMNATVVGLVTPHLLRVVDLGNEAEKGVNVAWHVRDAVARTMSELSQQYNAPALVAAYVDGLEATAATTVDGQSRLLMLRMSIRLPPERRDLYRDAFAAM